MRTIGQYPALDEQIEFDKYTNPWRHEKSEAMMNDLTASRAAPALNHYLESCQLMSSDARSASFEVLCDSSTCLVLQGWSMKESAAKFGLAVNAVVLREPLGWLPGYLGGAFAALRPVMIDPVGVKTGFSPWRSLRRPGGPEQRGGGIVPGAFPATTLQPTLSQHPFTYPFPGPDQAQHEAARAH